MTSCEHIQERLAEHGRALLERDEAVRVHCGECAVCRSVLEALERIDLEMEALPRLSPPDALVDRALAGVAASDPPAIDASESADPAPQPDDGDIDVTTRQALALLLASLGATLGRRRTAVALAGLALVALIVTPVYLFTLGSMGDGLANDETAAQTVRDGRTSEISRLSGLTAEEQPPASPDEPAAEARSNEMQGDQGPVEATGRLGSTPLDRNAPSVDLIPGGLAGGGAPSVGGWGTPQHAGELYSQNQEQPAEPETVAEDLDEGGRYAGRQARDLLDEYRRRSIEPHYAVLGDDVVGGEALPRLSQPTREPRVVGESGDLEVTISREGHRGENIILADPQGQQPVVIELGNTPDSTLRLSVSSGPVQTGGDDRTVDSSAVDPASSASTALEPAWELARRFLAESERVADIHFVEPRGYWANTYIPGDPVLRRIEQRLSAADALALRPDGATGLAVARQVRPLNQPFDVPAGVALSVDLRADRSGVEGSSRALLQVGLQATARRSGRRPTMNVVAVLDLTGPMTTDSAAAVRALLEAMNAARDTGDRFTLMVAGRPGGTVLSAGQFRHGPVSVAARQLLVEGESLELGETDVTYDLPGAVEAALAVLGAHDDPTAPLGSSLVLLVTPGDLGGDVSHLERLAHTGAVAGLPTSVVGVGSGVDLAALDRIALAGQGNRRLLPSAAQAEAVLDRELAAVSRVVARAVRLNIRLAPGVQLVNVLGSYRLDDASAERVREAERSIDLRVARNLGIEADRGEDEDGIQIVIPTFYAEDAHTILLDVLVPGPGPAAEVTVRYKDLVYGRNGVARDSLTLSDEPVAPGPLELNVLKNRVAFEMSQALRLAGTLAHDGRFDAARAEVNRMRLLLLGLQVEMPDFAADPELGADLAAIVDYLTLLESAREGTLARPNDLADSLLYAGYRKLLGERSEP